MKINIEVWRQKSENDSGYFEKHVFENVSKDMSFLEMLDVLNEQIIKSGALPIEFESDCREGICGSCGIVINGQAHGPELGTTTCQLYMRAFNDGDSIVIEPWRAKSFKVIKDLVVDKSPLDRIIQSGGYISCKSGPHADANSMLVSKINADIAMEKASCIGCGACVAACPNASASLFTAAKIMQLGLLPQGQIEAKIRVKNMVNQMDIEGFGNCSNIGECRAACPAEISIDAIAYMKKEYFKALID